MAEDITLGTLRDLWAAVADSVGEDGQAKVDNAMQIAGSDGTNTLVLKTTDDGTLLTKLSGSIVEYAWFTGGTQATPTEDFAWGYEFNTSTGALKVYGWTGSAWVEVV